MSAWEPSSDEIERAVSATEQLRNNTKTQWVDARQRLEASGISVQNAVLASWQAEGQGVMCGVIAARDGRLIDFCVAYGLNDSGRPLGPGVGRITSWKEVPPEKIGPTSAGYPNSWAQDQIIARKVFDLETPGNSS